MRNLGDIGVFGGVLWQRAYAAWVSLRIWGIWIDGKDATGGSEAYGANYSSLMKHALQEAPKLEF